MNKLIIKLKELAKDNPKIIFKDVKNWLHELKSLGKAKQIFADKNTFLYQKLKEFETSTESTAEKNKDKQPKPKPKPKPEFVKTPKR